MRPKLSPGPGAGAAPDRPAHLPAPKTADPACRPDGCQLALLRARALGIHRIGGSMMRGPAGDPVALGAALGCGGLAGHADFVPEPTVEVEVVAVGLAGGAVADVGVEGVPVVGGLELAA